MNPLSRAASLVCVVVFVCAIPVGHAQEHSRAAANPLPLLSVSDSWTYQAFDGDGKATARIVATAVQLSDDGARIQYRVESCAVVIGKACSCGQLFTVEPVI